MDNPKEFPLRVVLTVTTGRLLTKRKEPTDNGIGDLYELLAHMTGDTPWTHTLGRFAEECKPWLYRWHPWLREIGGDVAHLDVLLNEHKTAPDVACDLWIEDEERQYGKTVPVGRIPADDHERKHPYDELVQMRGTDEGIIICKADGK